MDFEKEARDFWDDALSWVSAQQENWVCRKEVETLIRRAFIAGQIDMREQSKARIKQVQQDFLSPDYAVGQPLSSFNERFACGQCFDEVSSLPTLDNPIPDSGKEMK